MDSENYSHTCDYNIWGVFMQIVMPYWNFRVHKDSITLYTVVKVVVAIDPATEVTHLGLN